MPLLPDPFEFPRLRRRAPPHSPFPLPRPPTFFSHPFISPPSISIRSRFILYQSSPPPPFTQPELVALADSMGAKGVNIRARMEEKLLSQVRNYIIIYPGVPLHLSLSLDLTLLSQVRAFNYYV